MAAWYGPIPVGSKTSQATLLSDLGNIYVQGSKSYVVAKTGAALASCGRKVVATALDATTKLPTWIVTTTTTAGDATAIGIIDPAQVDLASGDFFMLQIAGPAEVISAAAIAASAPIGASTTAGKCDDASITAGVGDLGVSLEAATGADENVAVLLRRRF